MRIAAALMSLALCGTSVEAQSGFDFVTIGDAGNAPYVPVDNTWVDRPVGGVNYEYRISKTEVAVSQWVEFANAYAPYYAGSRLHPEMTGYWVAPTTLDPSVPASYYAMPGSEKYSADTSWRMAARFCNWLHNGKSSEAWVFESGVYDTSTFGKDANNYFTDQPEPSPGAKYWLPSWDELVKASYYDPNKNGQGPGYWTFPTSSDTAPIQGLPENGGQTNAGGEYPSDLIGFLDVGSYDVQSPWGLKDVSGSLPEWTGSWGEPLPFARRLVGSTLFWSDDWQVGERLDRSGGATFPNITGFAFRIATVVPSPANASLFAVAMLCSGLNRRKRV